MASSTLQPVSPPRFRQRFITTTGASDLRDRLDRFCNGTIIHNRVFIGGLHHSVTENVLEHKFGCYGEISDIKIIKKPDMEKGYAFITFEKQEDASKVLEHSGTKVKINGVESKIGPAIRKPSPNESAGKLDGSSFVLKSLGTSPTKRGRTVSSPASVGEAGAAGTINTIPIPVPMPKCPNQECDNQVVGNPYAGENMAGSSFASQNAFLQQLANQKAQQDFIQSCLLTNYHALSPTLLNPLLIQALLHQQKMSNTAAFEEAMNRRQQFMQDDGVFLNTPSSNSRLNLSPQSITNQVETTFFGGTPENSPVSANFVRTPDNGINQSFIFPLSQPRNPSNSAINQLNLSPASFDQSNLTQNIDQSNLSPNNVDQPNLSPATISQSNPPLSLIDSQVNSTYCGHNIPLGQSSQPYQEAAIKMGQGRQMGPLVSALHRHSNQGAPPFLPGGISGTFEFIIDPISSPE